MTRCYLALLAAGGLVAFAAAPKRDWKTGTLVDAAEVREVAGSTTMNQGGGYGPAMKDQAVVYATLQGFVIKGDGIGWMVQVRIPPGGVFRHPKRPNVTVNARVKYCYEKGKFYLLDDDGREFEMTVMRKEALPPPAPAKQP